MAQFPLVLSNGQMQQLQSGEIADIGCPVGNLKNVLLNNDFRINQRGANTYSAASEAIFDCWRMGSDGTLGTRSTTRETPFGDSALPWGIRSNLKIDQTVAGSGMTLNRLAQRVEFVDTFAGKTVTFSFYCKADSSRTLNAGITQSFGTGGSPSSDVISGNQNFGVTTSWQRVAITFDVPSVNGKVLGSNGNDYLAVYVNLPLNATFTFYFTAAQLEIGPEATEYEFLTNNLLRLLSGRQVRGVGSTLSAISNSTTQIIGCWTPGTAIMRATPTATLSTTSPIFRFPAVGDFTGSSSAITAFDGNSGGGAITINGFTGLTAGRAAFLTSGSILLDAQL